MTSYFHVRCCLNCAIRSVAEGRRNSTQHHPSQARIFSIPTGYRSRGINHLGPELLWYRHCLFFLRTESCMCKHVTSENTFLNLFESDEGATTRTLR